MTDDKIIKIRQVTRTTDLRPWADTLAFARAVIEAYKQEQTPIAEIIQDQNGVLSTQWYSDWVPNAGDKLFKESK